MTTAHRRAAAAIAAPLLLVALAAGCGSDSEGDANGGAAIQKEAGNEAGMPDAATITIKSFKYSPTPLKVKAGSSITVRNEDGTDHTLTADDDKAFDTMSFQGEKTITAPSEPGTYSYHCHIHDYMKGVIQVEE